MWRGKTLLNVVLKLVGILVALQEIAFFEQMRAGDDCNVADVRNGIVQVLRHTINIEGLHAVGSGFPVGGGSKSPHITSEENDECQKREKFGRTHKYRCFETAAKLEKNTRSAKAVLYFRHFVRRKALFLPEMGLELSEIPSHKGKVLRTFCGE